MARDSMTSHQHCWHFVSGYTNGLQTSGQDTEVCCHCGATGDKSWSSEHDPKHGPHIDTRVRKYDQLVIRP